MNLPLDRSWNFELHPLASGSTANTRKGPFPCKEQQKHIHIVCLLVILHKVDLQIIAWNHADFNFPFAQWLGAIGDNGEDNRIGASLTHVHVNYKEGVSALSFKCHPYHLLCCPVLRPQIMGSRSPTVLRTMKLSVVQNPFSSGPIIWNCHFSI